MAYLLGIPLALLTLGKGKTGLLVAVIVYLLCTFCLKRCSRKCDFRLEHPAVAALVVLILSVMFYLRWVGTGRMAALSEMLKLPVKQVCGMVSLVLSMAGLFAADMLLSLILRQRNPQLNVILLIALTAFLTMLIGSKCSPLYAFNDWSDPNTMFTIGKSMLWGKVPYRDLFEQKGPLLIALHGLGAAISFDTFLGMWLLEIITAFCFLYFSYRILELYLDDRALFLIPLLALIVYTVWAFNRGDSAEEFCLPLLTYALWQGAGAIRHDNFPRHSAWFLIGITAGCVLWIKFSLLGFYLGWIIPFGLIAARKNQIKQLLSRIGLAILGVLCVTLPFLVYFGMNHAIGDWFTCYFYDNLFLYPKMEGTFPLLRNWGTGVKHLLTNATAATVLIVLGIVWLAKLPRNLARMNIYAFLGLFLGVYSGGRFHTYYALIFGTFAIWGLCLPAAVLPKKGISAALSLYLCAIAVFLLSPNTYYLAYEKKDIAQYRVKEIINSSGIENPSLLNYHTLDVGFNTAAGLVPTQRYFFSPTAMVPGAEEEQWTCIENGCVDFVVTFMEQIELPNYVYVGTFEEFTDKTGQINVFHLYQRE